MRRDQAPPRDGFEGKPASSNWTKLEKYPQDTAPRDIDDPIGRGMLAAGQLLLAG